MPDFTMPSLGADMDRGTLTEWLVEPGDRVRRGDTVAVVETDKADIEVECFDDGVVDALLVQPGTSVPVGAPLARLTSPEAAPEPSRPAAPEPESSAPAGPP
ncbi:biotin/lipoyl-containing protein, partial [Actinomadura sp. NPDC000929]|uniref:biotin/lipoyl-containing protein n=1 Tax=Actinomadura sp. NPDC000929 TaxID=3154517 RepID=UPI00339668BE